MLLCVTNTGSPEPTEAQTWSRKAGQGIKGNLPLVSYRQVECGLLEVHRTQRVVRALRIVELNWRAGCSAQLRGGF